MENVLFVLTLVLSNRVTQNWVVAFCQKKHSKAYPLLNCKGNLNMEGIFFKNMAKVLKFVARNRINLPKSYILMSFFVLGNYIV